MFVIKPLMKQHLETDIHNPIVNNNDKLNK